MSRAAAAVADGLVVPLLLQLAPAVMQLLRDGAGEGQAGRAATHENNRVAWNYVVLVLVVLRHGSPDLVLGVFRRNQAAVEAALEAAVRLADGSTARWTMLSVLLPDVLNFMRLVTQSALESRGRKFELEVGCGVTWQPSLLLTCLKATRKCRRWHNTSPAGVCTSEQHSDSCKRCRCDRLGYLYSSNCRPR